MSTQDPVGDIYPRIESITDPFGRRIESATVDGEIAGTITDYNIVLRPGDSAAFTCIGLDPQNRDLHWRIGKWPINAGVISKSGAPAVLTWEVDDGDVTETAVLEIYLSTADSKYHRFGVFDHRAYFMFRVRPPATEH